MPDTMIKPMPETVCDDCGNKGCRFTHWGPLVPEGVHAVLCETCWQKRQDYYAANGQPKAMPPVKLGTVTTVNMNTGEIVSEKKGGFTLLGPAPHLCQECATKHEPDQSHNQQSIYYQTKFNAQHGRSPTWTDAMAHCTPEVQQTWRKQLIDLMKRNGLDIPPDLSDAKPNETP